MCGVHGLSWHWKATQLGLRGLARGSGRPRIATTGSCVAPPVGPQVIRNGEMLAVRERRNRNTLSTGSMAAAAAAAAREPTMVKYDGEEPTYYFSDGSRGTGTREVGTWRPPNRCCR